MMNLKCIKNSFFKKLLENNMNSESIKQRYNLLLEDVIETLADDIDSTRDLLFRKSGIENLVENFVDIQNFASGIVLSFGTGKFSKVIEYGNSREYIYKNGDFVNDIFPISKGSIFDLASVSKVFTCYTIMKLYEEGIIDIDIPISEYDKRFVNVQDYSLRNFLTFQKNFSTHKLITDAKTIEEAELILFNIQANELTLRPYSDMGSIIAKYIVENTLNKNFFDIVYEKIIVPCGLNETFISNSNISKDLFVSNNFERKILFNKCSVDCQTKLGVVHDSKAKLLGNFGKTFSGHAGLFSTALDMAKFSQQILNQKIISKSMIYEIVKNYVGFKDENENYSQFLGMLCHTKHPIELNSEVYDLLSNHAVAQGGYTGTYLTYDIDNDIYLFLGANRCHNRITTISQEISSENIKEANDWKIKYTNTHKYAWQRDELIHKALDLSIQYKFLEYIIQNCEL